jgi:hypothetical protein
MNREKFPCSKQGLKRLEASVKFPSAIMTTTKKIAKIIQVGSIGSAAIMKVEKDADDESILMSITQMSCCS